MKKTTLAILLYLYSNLGYTTILTTTIENIGMPYTVINGGCVYQSFPAMSWASKKVKDATQAAFKQIEPLAKAYGANAFIGLDVDYRYREKGKDNGESRVVICGTFVKIKKKDLEENYKEFNSKKITKR